MLFSHHFSVQFEYEEIEKLKIQDDGCNDVIYVAMIAMETN